MIYPAFENSLSEGVLVAGTQKGVFVLSLQLLKTIAVLSLPLQYVGISRWRRLMYVHVHLLLCPFLIDIRFFAAGIVNMSPRSIPSSVFFFFEGGSRSSYSESNSSSCSASGVMFIITSATKASLLASKNGIDLNLGSTKQAIH